MSVSRNASIAFSISSSRVLLSCAILHVYDLLVRLERLVDSVKFQNNAKTGDITVIFRWCSRIPECRSTTCGTIIPAASTKNTAQSYLGA
jgi:hypothetical protein